MPTAGIERSIAASPVELRSAPDHRRIGGYAAVFGKKSQNLGGFVEVVDRSAMNRSQGDGWPGVVARYNHQDADLLGTTHAGTLRLGVDQRGLSYEVDLPESRSDILELVTRGDIAHSSFAFQATTDEWTYDSGVALRTLLSVRLIDVAPVVTPAYPDATVGLRSLAAHMDADLSEIVDLANRNELRRLFTRSDRPLSGRQAYIDTLAKRWPHLTNATNLPTVHDSTGHLHGIRSTATTPRPADEQRVNPHAALAHLERMKRQWADQQQRKPRSGREALIETLGKWKPAS